MRKKENIDLNWIWEVCWMRNKMRTMLILFLFSAVGFCVPDYALDSDFSYNYKTEHPEAFVILGKSNINIQGEIPDYLRYIYDVSPLTLYASE